MASPNEFDEIPAEEEGIDVIEFTEADTPEISTLLRLVWPHAKDYPKHWQVKRCLTTQQIIKEMRKGYHYFGARLDGQIVGLYKAILTHEGLLGEHQSVHPDYRHRGLVRAMYRQFITYAQTIGAAANLCNILVSQQIMCRLVESFGFKPYGLPYEQSPGMPVQLYRRPTNPIPEFKKK